MAFAKITMMTMTTNDSNEDLGMVWFGPKVMYYYVLIIARWT